MNRNETAFQINFGAFADKILRQCRSGGWRLKRMDACHIQADADAITRLAIRGILTDHMTRMARKKLMTKMILVMYRP